MYLRLSAAPLPNLMNDDALREAEWASRARPAEALAWTLQGEALRQMHRLPEARIAFRRALDLDPNDEHASIGLRLSEGTPDSARVEKAR